MTYIKIGNVKIDNVEIKYGVVRKIGKTPRTHRGHPRQRVKSISSKVLKRLIHLWSYILKAGYSPCQIDQPVLVEYIQKELELSKKTAYDYANTMHLLCNFYGKEERMKQFRQEARNEVRALKERIEETKDRTEKKLLTNRYAHLIRFLQSEEDCEL